jgi:hypothetical protein
MATKLIIVTAAIALAGLSAATDGTSNTLALTERKFMDYTDDACLRLMEEEGIGFDFRARSACGLARAV